MDQSQVIFEYGKLQLNFVASQQQVAQLGTLLAQANKEINELRKQIEALKDASTQNAKPEVAINRGSNLREIHVEPGAPFGPGDPTDRAESAGA